MNLPFRLTDLAVGLPRDPLACRDPEFIRAELPRLGWLYDHYNDIVIEGLDDLPRGRALIVGNHNGGIVAPDMFALMVAHWRAHGVGVPAYGLMHDLPFYWPLVGRYLARLGAVPARPDHARALLERDARVLVYPGGDLDAFKPWSRRHEVVFGERTGFVRVALRARAPIVPVVSVGAHESFRVLTDGADLARRLGLKRTLRVEVLPIALGLPWGLFPAMAPYWPLPVRMKVRLLPPITWPDLPPEAADDDERVWHCREQVRTAMQQALDEMAREGNWGRRALGEVLIRSLRSLGDNG
jgi:1-acyl-sn-glycerol-3-phosphate acyltransferase